MLADISPATRAQLSPAQRVAGMQEPALGERRAGGAAVLGRGAASLDPAAGLCGIAGWGSPLRAGGDAWGHK